MIWNRVELTVYDYPCAYLSTRFGVNFIGDYYLKSKFSGVEGVTMLIKRCIPIILILLIVTACDTFADNADDVVLEDTSAQDVAQVATDVPVEDPTSEPVVVEPTRIPPTDISPTSVPVQPTDVPPTSEPETASYNAPDWTNLTLTNAQTGTTFTLADFAGKTVLIEPMATWCPNCRTQQGYVAQAMEQVNTDDFVFISLSVGENVSNQTLANYAVNNGFPQIFVVATPEFTNALVQDFGFSVTTPPSTPHFTISPIGTVSSLSTGYHQADDLVNELLAAQNS